MKYNKVEAERKREAVINVFGEENSYNAFYDSVSLVFRMASFIIIAAFLFFIVTSAFNNANEFSYDNLEYIVRNFALTLDENKDDTVYSIRYNPDSSRTYSLFGKGLSVCGNSGISVYSATGRQTCAKNFNYKDPVMISSEKYALVYDRSGEKYSLYNTFTEVYSTETAYPIRGAAISNNGYYALITSSDEYKSTVEVYNDNFSIVNRFNKTGYVIDIDIVDGEILIATVDTDPQTNGYSVELLLANIGETEPRAVSFFSGSFPLSCNITSDGYMVVCVDSVIFFDSAGKEISSYLYDSEDLSKFDFDGENVLLLFKEPGFNLSYRSVCINSACDTLYEYEINSTVFDIEFCGGRAFVLTESSLIAVDASKTTAVDFDGADHNCKLLAYDERAVYVCTDTAAPLIEFDY